jgi:hypothetical protein
MTTEVIIINQGPDEIVVATESELAAGSSTRREPTQVFRRHIWPDNGIGIASSNGLGDDPRQTKVLVVNLGPDSVLVGTKEESDAGRAEVVFPLSVSRDLYVSAGQELGVAEIKRAAS